MEHSGDSRSTDIHSRGTRACRTLEALGNGSESNLKHIIMVKDHVIWTFWVHHEDNLGSSRGYSRSVRIR